MKTLLVALMLVSAPVIADETKVVNCSKTITVELSQTSYTLNVWKHIRNAVNSVQFQLPVSCDFYDQVQIGDELLKKKFRWGSLAVHGSMGTWNLEIVGK